MGDELGSVRTIDCNGGFGVVAIFLIIVLSNVIVVIIIATVKEATSTASRARFANHRLANRYNAGFLLHPDQLALGDGSVLAV